MFSSIHPSLRKRNKYLSLNLKKKLGHFFSIIDLLIIYYDYFVIMKTTKTIHEVFFLVRLSSLALLALRLYVFGMAILFEVLTSYLYFTFLFLLKSFFNLLLLLIFPALFWLLLAQQFFWFFLRLAHETYHGGR